MRKMDWHYVYLITDGEFVKVGKAKHPEQRLKTLQVGNARALRVIRTFPFCTAKEALEAERLHHVYLRDVRLVGEWFPKKAACRAHRRLVAKVFL